MKVIEKCVFDALVTAMREEYEELERRATDFPKSEAINWKSEAAGFCSALNMVTSAGYLAREERGPQ